MKYISEERLKEILASFNNNFGDVVESKRCLLDYLLEFECTELNQWHSWSPIEPAPKDRRILLLYEDGDVRIDWWHHESQQDNKIVAWIEIPEPPK